MEKKNNMAKPITFSILLGLLLIFLVSFASAAAVITGAGDNGVLLAQGGAFLIMAVIVTFYMFRHESLAVYGFHKVDSLKAKKTLYYIPLILIALVQPVLGGINTGLTLSDILLFLVFTAIVGYTEESTFRGIIRVKLQSKGASFYIIFSSILFGILHMANALNGNLLNVLLQVANAFLIGIILSLLITTADTIIPLIIFHFLYDALAFMTKDQGNGKQLMIISVLNIFYIIYGIYLIIGLKNRKKL